MDLTGKSSKEWMGMLELELIESACRLVTDVIAVRETDKVLVVTDAAKSHILNIFLILSTKQNTK